MNRVVSAIKLDFFTAKSTLMFSLLTYIASFGIGAATKQAIFTPLFVMVFAVFLGGTVFSIHEKSRSERLYGILPLKRSQVICGRYLYAVIVGTLSAAVGGALEQAAVSFLGADVNGVLFWGALAASFLYYCFAAGVSYPIYFKVGFSKAYVFTMLPMYLVILGIMLLTRRMNYSSEFNRFILFFSNKQLLIPLLGLFGGLILLAISAVISNRIYACKEI